MTEETETTKKTNHRPRKIVITVNYHYTGPGRRAGLRKDIAERVLASIIRRMERSGILVVDSVSVKEA